MYEKKFIRCLLYLTLILCFSITTGVKGANILFIAAMERESVDAAGDDALKTFLESKGHTVTYLDDDTAELDMEAAAAAADVVYISESVGSAKVQNKNHGGCSTYGRRRGTGAGMRWVWQHLLLEPLPKASLLPLQT